MISQDKIDRAKEAYTSLYYEFQRPHDFKIGRSFYWFGASQTVGTVFDPFDCSVTLWRVSIEENIFDEWHDGQFVWDEVKFKEYMKIVSNLIDEEILE
jgi:hypothetical protein